MTRRVLVICTETGGAKDLTHMTEYRPGEDGITLDHERGFGSDDLTATISMVNPTITHYTSTAPVGSADVAHHLGVLPDPMDYMKYRWGKAISSTPVHVGDTLIQRDPVGESFSVFKADRDYPHPPLDMRILHRAPREPWADLADVLGTNSGELIGEHHSITEVAKALHERGVRVTGGDES